MPLNEVEEGGRQHAGRVKAGSTPSIVHTVLCPSLHVLWAGHEKEEKQEFRAPLLCMGCQL